MLPSTADSSIHAANEVAARLRVDIRTGLTWAEAKYRAKIIGYNELHADEDEPAWKKYVDQFKNPLILLLLGELLLFGSDASKIFTLCAGSIHYIVADLMRFLMM